MSKELEVYVYMTLSSTCLLQNYAFTLRSHKLYVKFFLLDQRLLSKSTLFENCEIVMQQH